MNKTVVAPFLISQCYNCDNLNGVPIPVVAPFLISQCYNYNRAVYNIEYVVAPFLISQCYNNPMGNPYYVRVSRFICSEKMGLK